MDVLDRHLKDHEYMAGDEYTIADMAIWPWYGGLALGHTVRCGRVPTGAGVRSCHPLDKGDRGSGLPSSAAGWSIAPRRSCQQLHERHDASDFETKTQDKLTK